MYVIVPASELKDVIDKTAQFVAKFGEKSEKRILTGDQSSKFSFLKLGDLYYPYYKHQVIELKKNSKIEDSNEINDKNENDSSIITKAATNSKTKKPKSTINYLFTQEMSFLKPSEAFMPHFSFEIPDIPAQDLDVIKLTAQFVAKNGRQFQTNLLNREFKNPQFDFLRPTSSLHTYYNSLVEAYSTILIGSKQILQKLESNKIRNSVLKKIMARVEWEKLEAKTRKSLEQEEEEERLARAAIDWHDFFIVETIDFLSDNESVTDTMDAPKPPAEDVEMDMDETDIDSATNETIKVKKNYVRMSDQQAKSVKFQVCPICNQQIPVTELAEHMKIELSNQNKKNANENKKNAIFANNQDIAKNINAFSVKRKDIFGSADSEFVGKTDKSAKPDNTIWDGHSASIPRTSNAVLSGLTIEKQLANTQKAVEKSTIIPNPLQMNTNQPPIIPTLNFTPRPVSTIPVPVNPLVPTFRPMLFSSMPTPNIPTQFSNNGPNNNNIHNSVIEEPNSKKIRIDEMPSTLIPEELFLLQHPGTIIVKVQAPVSEKTPWQLNGQLVNFEMTAKSTIGHLKEQIKQKLNGMPTNKQNLKAPGLPFLKDQNTLASYNITSDILINLLVKERGGRG
eukprot:TRINITY_DN8437_c0_g1_i1.p1 TRINITY_DN8437_c0_g1~~TRINITY_DN8437_c0_g1_i1.p1  ORF type:complete len:622 (-),score=280.66 TRINITY_DN8437_c0_g1_i1:15-1880(-)